MQENQEYNLIFKNNNFFHFGNFKLNSYYMYYEINRVKSSTEIGTKITGDDDRLIRDMFASNLNRNFEGFPPKNSKFWFEVDLYRNLRTLYVWWYNDRGDLRKQLIGSRGYIEKSRKDYITKAFRKIIIHQIAEFKRNEIKHITHCPITGKPINSASCLEADHIISFADIVRNFLEIYGDEFIELDTTSYIPRVDKRTMRHFLAYHRVNAKLRLVSHEGHITL